MKTIYSILIIFACLIAGHVPSAAQNMEEAPPAALPGLPDNPELPSNPANPSVAFQVAPDLSKLKDLWKDYLSEPINLTAPAHPGIAIDVVHKFGNVTVRRGSDSEITITGEKGVSSRHTKGAQEFLDRMEVRIEQSPEKITIETFYPDKDNFLGSESGNLSFSISYELRVPGGAVLNVQNSFGDVDCAGLSGECTIKNSHGKIIADRLGDKVRIENNFGEISASGIDGEASIINSHGAMKATGIKQGLFAKNRFGTITVRDVGGDAVIDGAHSGLTAESIRGSANITNSFSSVTCREITGALTIDNSHGAVNIDNIGNNATVGNKFGSVTMRGIRGNAGVDMRNGPVEAIDISGSLTVMNAFGPLTARMVRGDVQAEMQNGNVDADEITGSLRVKNAFGSVSAGSIAENVTIENRNGPIRIHGILARNTAKVRRVKLNAEFSDISIDLPVDVSATLSASTTFGEIRCDFPVRINSRDHNSLSISGELGEGAGKDVIEIEARHTPVIINKK